MRDTAKMEHTAEDYISFKLQEGPLLIAKPKFDIDGTDLLALLPDETHGRFSARLGRIQSKGRSLKNTPHSPVDIPCVYVRGPFFVFLYIDYRKVDNLYVFFVEDIEKWEVKEGKYVLDVTRKAIEDGSMDRFLFNADKAQEIVETIRRTPSEMEKEMYQMLKMGQDVIEKQRVIEEITDILHKLTVAKKDIELQNGILTETYLEVQLLAREIVEKAPAVLLERINRYKEDGLDEEHTYREVVRRETNMDTESTWLIILHLYDSVEKKFMIRPDVISQDSSSI